MSLYMGLFRTISRSLIYILIFRHTGRTVLDQLGPTVKQLGPTVKQLGPKFNKFISLSPIGTQVPPIICAGFPGTNSAGLRYIYSTLYSQKLKYEDMLESFYYSVNEVRRIDST